VVLTSTPIKPYWLIHLGRLPANVSSKFPVLSWMPILKLMTSGRNNLPALASGAALDELHEQGLKRIKDIAEFIFLEDGSANWAVSTWSQKTTCSAISKHGTEADKARLDRVPVPHQQNRTQNHCTHK
jgi:hypothetical protein